MSAGNGLQEFLDAAKQQGTTDEILVGLLRGRGWHEDDVYRALADHYEARGGVQVPVYRRSGSAKDAFLYLLSFSTLATWTFALGSIMFTLHRQKENLTPCAGASSAALPTVASTGWNEPRLPWVWNRARCAEERALLICRWPVVVKKRRVRMLLRF